MPLNSDKHVVAYSIHQVEKYKYLVINYYNTAHGYNP